ncbi:TetR/AcrR family transcriptional regulator [Microbacterium mangrovi]|uniref:TetR/AcrR family transcriptional regulator n=1 Tax=Microbacterium mangrovi TaxID=1348253 RepID=UPI00068D5058|nr:TetR/AcrR family transcriptional regulator [Microbacterium mangrovi]
MASKRGTYRTGRERVESILDAAHMLFVRNGYRATSLREIASEAGISHPAVLRYFANRGEILTALIARLDTQSERVWNAAELRAGSAPSAAAVARANNAVPGWIELFTALLGEATSPEHPGHPMMLHRRQEGRRRGRAFFDSIGLSATESDLATAEIIAGWEGLQILTLYFPGQIDIPAQLDEFEGRVTHLAGASAVARIIAPTSEPRLPPALAGDDPRARIVAAAAKRYARHGYYETSMQMVADDAGVTRAALIHVAPTKQALLELVVAALYDRVTDDPWMLHLERLPRWVTAAEIVLLCEATVAAHPLHDTAARQLAWTRQELTTLLQAQGVAGADARTGADWLIAVGLGCMIAWLYEPDTIDPDVVLETVKARILGAATSALAPLAPTSER